MGRRETPLVHYYDKAVNFAALINGWLFGGEEQIHTEDISDEDRRFARRRGRADRKDLYQERYRDIYKRVGRTIVRLLIGTEIQTSIHYLMPLRVMDYETMAYWGQADLIRQRHQVKKDLRGAEYLSGFAKEDSLLPVITLVLYVGEEPWDGAQNLRELLDLHQIPERLREYVQDYHIHVLDVCHIPEERLLDFSSDIRFMFRFLKNQKDKNALKYLLKTSAPEIVSDDTYTALADYTGEPELLNIMEEVQREGGRDMCQAIREMVEDGRQEGRRQGEQRLRLLMTRMRDAGEQDMILRIVEDEAFLQEMYRKYHMTE